MIAYINNEFIPVEKASIHVSDLSVQRGYGVFDFFKVVDGHPYFLEDYLDRFYRSALRLRLKVPMDRNGLVKIITRLVAENKLASSGIKLILTGGYSPDGYEPATPNLIATQHALVLPDERIVAEGVGIITHEYVRDIPEAKTINYTMGISLLEKIRHAGAYDVLYHRDGIVSEFPRSNFFIVHRDGTVATAKKDVLQGITRKNVLSLAAKHFTAEESDITLEDVSDAAEAFITSTTKRIIPVTSIDGSKINDGKPGPVSRALLQHLIALEEQDRKNIRQ